MLPTPPPAGTPRESPAATASQTQPDPLPPVVGKLPAATPTAYVSVVHRVGDHWIHQDDKGEHGIPPGDILEVDHLYWTVASQAVRHCCL